MFVDNSMNMKSFFFYPLNQSLIGVLDIGKVTEKAWQPHAESAWQFLRFLAAKFEVGRLAIMSAVIWVTESALRSQLIIYCDVY